MRRLAASPPSAAERQRAELAGYRDLWRAVPAGLAARHGIAALDLAGGVCLGCASRSGAPILNHALGLGLAEPAGDAELAAVERFYAGLGVRYLVAVAEGAEGLGERLAARGFTAVRPWMTFHREAGPVPPPARGPRAVEAGPGDAAAFGGIVAAAFEMPPEFSAWFAALVGRPGWTCLLAVDGDAPIGAAALFVEAGSAWFTFGATLPDRRGRGAQGTLFAARARRALELGARHFVTETGAPLGDEGPGPSYRNMLRSGFAEVAMRRNLSSPAPAAS